MRLKYVKERACVSLEFIFETLRLFQNFVHILVFLLATAMSP